MDRGDEEERNFLNNPFEVLNSVDCRTLRMVVLRLVDLFDERRAATRRLVRDHGAAREKLAMEVMLEEQGLLDVVKGHIASSSTSISRSRVKRDMAIFPDFAEIWGIEGIECQERCCLKQ